MTTLETVGLIKGGKQFPLGFAENVPNSYKNLLDEITQPVS